MAQAARARYGYYSGTAPRRSPERTERPDIRVIPGRRSQNPALRGLPPAFVRAFALALAVIVFVAAVGFARVALSAATVENLEHTQKLASQLETAQASGNELEIRHSMLASSSRIENKAKALGMVQPDKVTYLSVDLSGVVATNPDGTVSLGETLDNIAASGSSATR